MSLDRRAQRIVELPDGRVWSETAMAVYLAGIDRRDARARVERRSTTDPFCAATEQTSRDRRPASRWAPDLGPDRGLGGHGSVDQGQAPSEAPDRKAVVSSAGSRVLPPTLDPALSPPS